MSHFRLVYMILDKPEECTAGGSGFSALLEMAHEGNVSLKTLIVVDKDQTADGRVESWRASMASDSVDVIDNLDQMYL